MKYLKDQIEKHEIDIDDLVINTQSWDFDFLEYAELYVKSEEFSINFLENLKKEKRLQKMILPEDRAKTIKEIIVNVIWTTLDDYYDIFQSYKYDSYSSMIGAAGEIGIPEDEVSDLANSLI